MPNYGVYLNIHPSETQKGVTIHKLPCSSYKQHHGGAGMYTFHKNCGTFDEAIRRASEWALNWHAPIKICRRCRHNWQLP
jgi:hypothetical protein